MSMDVLHWAVAFCMLHWEDLDWEFGNDNVENLGCQLVFFHLIQGRKSHFPRTSPGVDLVVVVLFLM